MSRIGVVTFPGTLDDTDAARAIRLAGSQPVYLWHASRELSHVDAVVLPGGFSYGDYLRAGAIAALAPVMAAVKDAANRGTPILGICNGFQILCEAGLLPGALVRNKGQRFMCRDQQVRVDNANTAWTGEFEPGQEITLPLKNGEGRFIAEPHVLNEIEAEGRVAFRYVGNPNGSMNDIAGLTDSTGRIVGIMPHPEHAVEPGFGPTTAAGPRTGTDGLELFHSVLDDVLSV